MLFRSYCQILNNLELLKKEYKCNLLDATSDERIVIEIEIIEDNINETIKNFERFVDYRPGTTQDVLESKGYFPEGDPRIVKEIIYY